MSPLSKVGLRSLSTLARGQVAVVAAVDAQPEDAAYLRAMGLRPAAFVRVCRAGEPCVVEVMGGTPTCTCHCRSRIGLARPLAERVLVSAAEPTASSAGG